MIRKVKATAKSSHLAFTWQMAGIYKAFGIYTISSTFLVDGFVRGVWRVEYTPASATLVIEAFEPLPLQVQNQLPEEERLMRWMLDSTAAFSIHWYKLPR